MLATVARLFAQEPIAMGAVLGIAAGALSGSGVVFFAAVVIGWLLGMHLRRSRHV
jgi:hypothetical protein